MDAFLILVVDVDRWYMEETCTNQQHYKVKVTLYYDSLNNSHYFHGIGNSLLTFQNRRNIELIKKYITSHNECTLRKAFHE